ncbi:MAG: hypothetical protein SFX72_07670 [Isosphaeraceae bacterium]|nr:hypothetical protein [Isosphaeraceae bacterium]
MKTWIATILACCVIGARSGDPARVEIGAIENAYRLSPRIYSGGEPAGRAALEALAKLGVKTIISVDGAPPDAETARSLGMRYVHLPIGYDGIPRDQAVRLVRAVETLDMPIYVHCHHGKHRGPAAAAICGVVVEGWSKDRAVDWMERAGTSLDYAGLYVSVREFESPTAEERTRIGNDLPERTAVPALTASMTAIDSRFDRLAGAIARGTTTKATAEEATLLGELFREAARFDDARARGADFTARLVKSADTAAELARILAGDEVDQARAKGLVAELKRSCTSCHSAFRDRPAP